MPAKASSIYRFAIDRFRKCLLLSGVAAAALTPFVVTAEETTYFSGNISAAQVFVRPQLPSLIGNSSTFTSGIAGGDRNDVRNYFAHNIAVGTGGLYNIEVESLNGNSAPAHAPAGDSVLYLYQDAFNSGNPLQNILVANDDKDHNTDYLSRIESYPLEPGTQYVAVVTTYNPNVTGGVRIAVSGAGSALSSPTAPVEPSIPSGVFPIDTSKDRFTETDEETRGLTVVFNGGILQPSTNTTPLVVQAPVQVQRTGGTINTSDRNVTLNQNISGVGQLTVSGGGQVIVNGHSTNSAGFEVQNATLRLNGSSVGPMRVQPTGTLRGTGHISGPTTISGTLAPGNSPGTLVFTAPVTLVPLATLSLDIDGTGTGNGASNYSRLILNGAGSRFTAAGTLRLVLRGITGAATNSFTPAVGQSFTVVQAEGGVSGRFSTVEQPTAGLAPATRFDVHYEDQAVRLVVVSTAPVVVVASGQTQNRQSFATMLGSLSLAGSGGTAASPEISAVLSGLSSMSASARAAAYDQLSGTLHAGTRVMDLNTRRLLGDTVFSRLGQTRRMRQAQTAAALAPTLDDTPYNAAPAASTPATASAWRMWAQSVVSGGTRDNDSYGPGFTYRTGGAFVGADMQPVPEATLGFGVGYARGRLDGQNGIGHSWVNSYQLAAYGQYEAGPAFMEAMLGYGYSRFETSRAYGAGTVAGIGESNSDGQGPFAALGVGYRFEVAGVRLEPRAGLRYDTIFRSGFMEEGAGDLSLAVQDSTRHSLRTSLGVGISRDFQFNDWQIAPELQLAWTRELLGEATKTTQTLRGVRFASESARSGRDAAVIGLGVSASPQLGVTFTAGTDAQFRRNDVSLQGRLGVRIAW